MGLFLSEHIKMQRLTIFSSPVGSAGKDLRDGWKININTLPHFMQRKKKGRKKWRQMEVKRRRRGRWGVEDGGSRRGAEVLPGWQEEKDEVGRASGASVIWGSGWLTVQSYTHLRTYPCSIYGLKRTTSAHRSAVGGLSSRCFRARASHVFSSYPGTATQMDIMWKMKRERARESSK